ncbi:MAG: hypothetical protein Q9219_002590 [cf. Caloplaca sp. 3 TL-2023]
MSISAGESGIIPAALAFLTIYNPSLSQNDDTIGDQIVYYYSKSIPSRAREKGGAIQHGENKELENEKSRQIGLAQGMVEFAKTFSDGQAVDSIETEKSRIILHNLEAEWWFLASIDLTRISSLPENKAITSPQKTPSKLDYSAREVSPPSLLLEQIIQAHQVFLLHHAQTLTQLLSRLGKPKFCLILGRFWDRFIRNWDVLLHGNPAVDIFNGLKLAAGGELGIGVGEEEWGSGEREVLEGFIGRTDGLVDLVVSRFGETDSVAQWNRDRALPEKDRSLIPADDWFSGQDPRPSDGVIFSGVGGISRASVKYISHWVVSLFKYGPSAYGVRDNPVAANRQRRKRAEFASSIADPRRTTMNKDLRQRHRSPPKSTDEQFHDFGIPAPIVGSSVITQNRLKQTQSNSNEGTVGKNESSHSTSTNAGSIFGTDTLMKYMTFGLYGSKSGTPSTDTLEHSLDKDSVEQTMGGKTPIKIYKHPLNTTNTPSNPPGYFMIGLQGDLNEENDSEDSSPQLDSATDREEVMEKEATSSRIMIRTLVVSRVERDSAGLVNELSLQPRETVKMSQDRLRVVVYVNRPFIFTFLFDLQTDNLAIPSFYRSLHHQLGPLQQPLLNSTSPGKVSERLSEASAPKSTAATRSSLPICDLVYDPYNSTVHTTIPNIPEPGSMMDEQAVLKSPWTRVEALSVHSQILNTYVSTRRRPFEIERTCKMNRGWWVVWMRLPHVAASQRMDEMVYREAFLIRKASDYEASRNKGSGGSWGRTGTPSSGWGPGKLAEGIGIDARQYIEGLVSLNR